MPHIPWIAPPAEGRAEAGTVPFFVQNRQLGEPRRRCGCGRRARLSLKILTAVTSGGHVEDKTDIGHFVNGEKVQTIPGIQDAAPSERLEGDDGAGVLDARDGLHLLVDEVADIGLVLDVELHQEVEVAGGRVDFGGELASESLFATRRTGRAGNSTGRRRGPFVPPRGPRPEAQSSKYGCGWQGPRAVAVTHTSSIGDRLPCSQSLHVSSSTGHQPRSRPKLAPSLALERRVPAR